VERHAHTYALPLAVAIVALAGCGGSGGSSDGGSDLAAVCKQQQAALASAARQPVGLRGATAVLRRVVAMDKALLATADDAALVGRIQRLDVNARRALSGLQYTDPDRSMFPMRTGAASARRALSAAQGLLNDACG
jgi:hypothetical protein